MNSNTDLFSAQCLSLHNTKEFFVKHLIYEPGSGAGLFKLFNLPNQIETKKRAKPEIIYHLGYHNKMKIKENSEDFISGLTNATLSILQSVVGVLKSCQLIFA